MPIIPTAPPVGDDALAAAIADLQAEYLASMPVRLAELRAALARVIHDPDARVTLQRAGHRIAGTAATIGLPELGDVGRAIEHHAQRSTWTAPEVAALTAAVDLVGDLAARAAAGDTLPPAVDDPRIRALAGASR